MAEAFALLAYYLLIYLFYRNSAFTIMDEVGMSQRLYEKHSITPSSFIRRHFILSKHN